VSKKGIKTLLKAYCEIDYSDTIKRKLKSKKSNTIKKEYCGFSEPLKRR